MTFELSKKIKGKILKQTNLEFRELSAFVFTEKFV